MAKKGIPKLTPSLIEEMKDRIRRTGSVESVYEQEPKIVTKATYDKWYRDCPELYTEIDAALGDHRRSQPGYFQHLAKACIEDYLTCHKAPKITTTKVTRTRYVAGKRPNELVFEFSEETETRHENILRCPPKIIEMILPQTPRTTIDVLATQMANEGILPQKRAEVIMAIADRAQENIREVLSGSSDAEEEL
jgi:hypothetical protein